MVSNNRKIAYIENTAFVNKDWHRDSEMFTKHRLYVNSHIDSCSSIARREPCTVCLRDFTARHGLTVFLRISEKAVVDRLLHAKRKRPLAIGKSETELTEFVARHYTARLPFYEQAKITVKAEDLDLEGLIRQIEIV